MRIQIKDYFTKGYYPLDRISEHAIPDYPGVYIVHAQILNNGEFKVVDVGQTKNLRERFELYHPRMDCWKSQGVSNLSVAVVYQINYKSRIRMEADLRDYFKPPCWWTSGKENKNLSDCVQEESRANRRI